MTINGNDRRTGHFGEGQCDGQQARLFDGFTSNGNTSVSSRIEQAWAAIGSDYRAESEEAWRSVREFKSWLDTSRPAWVALSAFALSIAAKGGTVTRDALCAFFGKGSGGHDMTDSRGRRVRLSHNVGTVALRKMAHDFPELAAHIKTKRSAVDEVSVDWDSPEWR